MRDLYASFHRASAPLPAGGNPYAQIPPCDETKGEDCFGGQRECLVECYSWPSRSAMRELAIRYDSVAELVATAAPGVSLEALDWLSGQRVGVWARLGELEEARRAVDACQGTVWWCLALHGFINHLDGEYVLAEELFRTALRLMPADTACYWSELTLYHDSLGASVRYGGGRNHCSVLRDYQEFWTLADPMFSVPGNDRMTEHYARHVDMRIHEQWLASSRPPGRHPLSHHSELLRYGWPTGYTTGTSRRLIFGAWKQGFVITTSVSEALRAPQWLFAPRPDAPERYRPRYGLVEAIPLQAGFFRKDGVPVLTVRSTAPTARNVLPDAWRFHSWDGDRFSEASVSVAADVLTVWFATSWRPQVISIEALDAAGALRGRSGTNPPDTLGTAILSSIVVLDEAPAAPASLDEAVGMMRPGLTVGPMDRVSAYWEVYTDEAMTAAIELATTSLRRPGLLSRLLGRGSPPARRVRWQEQIEPEAGVARRVVGLDVHALPPGPYEIRLTLRLADGAVLETRTTIRVEEPSAP